MNARRFATVTLCRYVVLAGCVAAWPAALGVAGSETSSGAPQTDTRASALTSDAEPAPAPQITATDDHFLGNAAAAAAAATVPAVTDPVSPTTTDSTTASGQPATTDKPDSKVETASASSSDMLPTETPSAPATTANRDSDANGAVNSIEVMDECFVVDICVDRYLWALYQRTPKEDSISQSEQRRVTVKKKGKTVTVTRTFSKLVDEDFGWKDPKAADKVGLSMMDYVIGGMDAGFKLKLFHTLHAAEAAGLSPGITSAFRDNYRQSIASGLKAATDRSFHGGSFRGGYGHGLAADIVSVKGATRNERFASTEVLWKWIDAKGKEFGIARPYLGRDPPHVAPIDGQEYAKHRGGAETSQHASSDVKKRKHVATGDGGSATKRANRSSKTSTIRSARDTPSRTARLHG